MRQLARGVYLIESLRGGNAYLLVRDDQLALIDTGFMGDAARIVTQIEEGGCPTTALRTVVLTHAHGDHIGGASHLVHRFSLEIIAHHAETPFIERRRSLPTRNALQRLMNGISERMQAEGEHLRVATEVQDGQTLGWADGLEVFHTPGHTPGSMCLYQPEKGVLFSGDLLIHGHPLTGRGGLQYGPRAFSVDPSQMERSARRVSALTINLLCPGHGRPIEDGADRRIRELVRGAEAAG
jgi:glyoxylase-like metal-dependent hydrolase (beta-lactamase superfamily II)